MARPCHDRHASKPSRIGRSRLLEQGYDTTCVAPLVVLPLATQHFMMLGRSLLYTAVTRGKRLVVIVGSRRAVSMAVRNATARARWTWLAERIREAASPGD